MLHFHRNYFWPRDLPKDYGAPKTSWWTEPGFYARAKAEAPRMRNSCFGWRLTDDLLQDQIETDPDEDGLGAARVE